MTRGEQFQELRPLLFAIAYRILGSVAEAEDAVQESWLRYESSPTQPTSTKAFLSAVVTRISIDVLRSARVRRETYVGPWFPEPLLTDPYEDPVRLSWPTRCRWRPCCCSSGSVRSSARSSCCGRYSGLAFRRSQLRSGVLSRRAASSRSGHDATWRPGALGSRRTAGNARSSRRGSSMRSGMVTSTNFPVADAWAIAREVKQARRSSD
jgi:hypothetical protein